MLRVVRCDRVCDVTVVVLHFSGPENKRKVKHWCLSCRSLHNAMKDLSCILPCIQVVRESSQACAYIEETTQKSGRSCYQHCVGGRANWYQSICTNIERRIVEIVNDIALMSVSKLWFPYRAPARLGMTWLECFRWCRTLRLPRNLQELESAT